MLENLTIKNVQSHECTSIDFSEGVNVIAGSSNSGKSVIMRSLWWLIYNRPLGVDALLSHWAYNGKGKQSGEMRVSVTTDGHKVERVRGKDVNGYVVDGVELDAVNSDVPEDVSRALRIGETNFQRQHDSPFLLSLTNGQIAQYFNRVVRLDVIDRVLGNAETRRRRINVDLKAAEERLERARADLSAFGFLDKAKRTAEMHTRVSVKVDALSVEAERLAGEIEMFESLSNGGFDVSGAAALVSDVEKACGGVSALENTMRELGDEIDELSGLCARVVPGLERVEELLSSISDGRERCDALSDEIDGLQSDIEDFARLKAMSFPDFSEAKKLLDSVSVQRDNTIELGERVTRIKGEIAQYDSAFEGMENTTREIAGLKAELPDVCPLCGGKVSF